MSRYTRQDAFTVVVLALLATLAGVIGFAIWAVVKLALGGL